MLASALSNLATPALLQSAMAQSLFSGWMLFPIFFGVPMSIKPQAHLWFWTFASPSLFSALFQTPTESASRQDTHLAGPGVICTAAVSFLGAVADIAVAAQS